MKAHFEMLASYNNWANKRLYGAVVSLSDEDYRRDCGAYFKSLHGTLNHMFVADVLWLARFRDRPNPPWPLDHVPHEDRDELRARRRVLDRDIIGFVGALTDAQFHKDFTYKAVVRPRIVTQPLWTALAHFFNHQTHHRGQCHAMLTRLTGEAPELDLIYYQRDE